MPLTFTPDESEERRRKMYGDLAASGTRAMGFGFDALSKMESLAKEKAATERQSTLDNDTRNKNAAELALKRKDEERNVSAEARAQAKHDYEMPRLKRLDKEAVDDRTLTLEANDRKQAQALIREAVAAGLARGEDPDTISTALQNRDDVQPFAPGMASLLDVDAEYEAQKKARALADTEMGLKQSQIDENQAQAARAARVPTGGAKATDPVKAATAAANLRKAEAQAKEAERKATANEAGEPMSESEVGKLARGDSLITDIESLQPIAAKQPMGVAGFLQRRIPDFAQSLKPDAMVQFDQMHGFVMKQIAKGIEEGAITPGEQEQYNNMLASSSSSPEAYMESLNRILGIMKQRQAAKREALKASGYNVPGPQGAAPTAPTALPAGDAARLEELRRKYPR